MNNKDSSSESSILNGNDAFVSKILSTRASAEQPSRRGYFSDNQSGIPFTWEEEPGIPKDPTPSLNFVPPIIPPPTKLTPLHVSKPTSLSQKSCFFIKPWWRFRVSKAKKENWHDDDEESIYEESMSFSEDYLFPSPRVSESSSLSSMASSKGVASPRFLKFAKGVINKWLF